MPRKNRNAPVAAAPAPVASLDVAPVAAAAPAPVPVRHSIGAPSSVRPVASLSTDDPSRAFALRGAYLNGTPGDRRSFAADAPTLTPVPLTADDAPALLTLAASLVAAAGAAGLPVNAIPSPSLAVGPLVRDYLSNRATDSTPVAYFAPNRMYGTDGNAANPTDTLYYLTRAALRLTYTADRLTNRTPRFAYSGGFGSNVAASAARDSLAAYLATRLPA